MTEKKSRKTFWVLISILALLMMYVTVGATLGLLTYIKGEKFIDNPKAQYTYMCPLGGGYLITREYAGETIGNNEFGTCQIVQNYVKDFCFIPFDKVNETEKCPWTYG